MYPDILQVIQSFYTKGTCISVVDTHRKGDFSADLSVADYSDARLLYCLRYFIELKFPGISLLTPENCGQILDYFNKAHEKQPHRAEFVAVLSDFDSAMVFTARYTLEAVNITKQPAPTFADAILHAELQSKSQYANRIPELDHCFLDNWNVLAVARNHFLLSVHLLSPAPATPTPASTISTRSQTAARITDTKWRAPSHHRKRDTYFVMKIAHGTTTVANEIKTLQKIREAEYCAHLPELVWSRADKELGIMPVSKPVDFQQVASVSRKIVEGLVDGLEHLHGLGIVHRDIRPSNLVLDYMHNVVIIDYETSVAFNEVSQVEYLGGFICWPERLLKSDIDRYKPQPTDDLLACILVVLHMLFPTRFNAFRASSIRVGQAGQERTTETNQVLKLWEKIRDSEIWGQFVQAAEDANYKQLKLMGHVFCHI
jgi:Protein kinase domain